MSLTGKELASLNLSRGDSTDNLLGMTDDRDVLLSPSVADCETSALIEPDPPPVMPLEVPAPARLPAPRKGSPAMCPRRGALPGGWLASGKCGPPRRHALADPVGEQ